MKYSFSFTNTALIFCIVLLSPLSTAAQNKDALNGIVIEAANPNFKTFELQQYNALPRLGLLGYYTYSVEMDVSKDRREESKRIGELAKTTIAKNEAMEQAREAYFNLLRMKMSKPYYTVMDKKLPVEVKYGNQIPPESMKSFYAQKNIKDIARYNTTDEYYNTVFPSVKRDSRSQFFQMPWGGQGASEFDQPRAYEKFINENLKDLQPLAETMITEGYYVDNFTLEDYSYQAGGYEMEIELGPFYGLYRPMLPFEKALKKSTNGSMLPVSYVLKMDAETAEELTIYLMAQKVYPNASETAEKQGNRKHVYTVWKISYQNNLEAEELKYDPNTNPSSFLYNIASPMVEIYMDQNLTQKLGEVDLSNPHYNE